MQRPTPDEPLLVGDWLVTLDTAPVEFRCRGKLCRAAYADHEGVSVLVFEEPPQIDKDNRVIGGKCVRDTLVQFPWHAVRRLRPLERLALMA